jgi:hypothetical protein
MLGIFYHYTILSCKINKFLKNLKRPIIHRRRCLEVSLFFSDLNCVDQLSLMNDIGIFYRLSLNFSVVSAGIISNTIHPGLECVQFQ